MWFLPSFTTVPSRLIGEWAGARRLWPVPCFLLYPSSWLPKYLQCTGVRVPSCCHDTVNLSSTISGCSTVPACMVPAWELLLALTHLFPWHSRVGSLAVWGVMYPLLVPFCLLLMVLFAYRSSLSLPMKVHFDLNLCWISEPLLWKWKWWINKPILQSITWQPKFLGSYHTCGRPGLNACCWLQPCSQLLMDSSLFLFLHISDK